MLSRTLRIVHNALYFIIDLYMFYFISSCGFSQALFCLFCNLVLLLLY